MMRSENGFYEGFTRVLRGRKVFPAGLTSRLRAYLRAYLWAYLVTQTSRLLV